MKLIGLTTILLATLIGIPAVTTPVRAVTVSLFCSSSGVEYVQCSGAAEKWAKQTGNDVKINKMPAAWDQSLPLYQQLLAAQSPDVDLLLVDIVWIGMLHNHLSDLNGQVPMQAAFFKSALSAGTVDGKFVAVPWYIDTGLMYYRSDLLKKYNKPVPTTWSEMHTTAKYIEDAERVAGNTGMWGYVWQGKAYEGLACNAYEWTASYGSGALVDDKGNITINNGKAVAALTEAASWVNDITPEGVLNYDEESSRNVFETGNSVFLRNWSYVWRTSQAPGAPLAGKVGVAPLPVGADGQNPSGCLGAGYLALSKYSKHPKEALSLLNYMSGQAEQKRRSIEASYNPTIASLYDDADILKASPFLTNAKTAFANAVTRPSAITGASYNKLSQAFYRAVHEVLAKEMSPADAMSAFESEAKQIKADGGW